MPRQTFPVPDDVPCSASSFYTVTFTVPKCDSRLWLVIGVVAELANAENYDDETGAETLAAEFQDAVDLVTIGESP